MNRTVIPTKDHHRGLLESDKSSEDHSISSAIAERSASCIVGEHEGRDVEASMRRRRNTNGGDVELSVWKPEGKEKENNDSDGVVVTGIRRRDNHLLHEQSLGSTTRSNKIAVQKETSLFDFALSFRPKGEEWRSQRRYVV